jgi:hypothetical protein
LDMCEFLFVIGNNKIKTSKPKTIFRTDYLFFSKKTAYIKPTVPIPIYMPSRP